MSYLRQFARNKGGSNRSEVLTARISKDLYDDFKEYCGELGLSISEAVNLLIDREMQENKGINTPITTKQPQSITESIHKLSSSSETATTIDSDSITTASKPTTIRPRSNTNSSSGGRFTTNPWKVDNELPCPICNSWYNASNFSRHAKSNHSKTTEELFTEYKDKADEMVEVKR